MTELKGKKLTFLYFAYGSNMLPSRLQDRCSSARLIGTAVAHGYEIEFSKRSNDGSGKATLVKRQGTLTPGAIFEMSSRQRALLDRFEGKGYVRDDSFFVECDDSADKPATASYFAQERDAQLAPYDWYLALIIAGAIHHQFSPEYIEHLKATKYIVDEDIDRDSRVSAIEALRKSGTPEFRLLLR